MKKLENLTVFKSVTVGDKAKVFQENKARQIFLKTNISYHLISTRKSARQGIRNVRFSENLACFVFLKHLFWDSPFCLIFYICFSVTKDIVSRNSSEPATGGVL